MVILGINDGHNSSAALIIDGKLKCAIAEERISRQKNHYGFPGNAIKCVLKYSGLENKDIDKIAMTSKHLPPTYFYTSRNSKLSIQDYWKEQKEFWYPKLYENKNPSYLEVLSHRVDKTNFPYDETLISNEADNIGMWNARVKHMSETLSVDPKDILHHDHHRCHAYYGYIASPLKNQPQLVYTMDGFGDGANGTVSIGNPNKLLNEISRSSNCNIGRMYRYATLLLGMRPAEHEYKLMGLAAYNSDKYGKKAYEIYAETLQVDGLGFKYKKEIKDHFFYFKDLLEGERFDAIAFGIQKRSEELLVEWISNGMKETGIKNIVMSGGVAQNIKANKKLIELKNLDFLFVPPGPGDESLAIGAAYLENLKHSSLDKITPFTNGYLGPSFTDEEIKLEINSKINSSFTVSRSEDKEVAELLSKGDIVARFGKGQMEFGARALGNRSILADPRRRDVIDRINKLVKMRDFWMPFAPSIISDREQDYILNPKGIDARYMSIGFDSTSIAERDIPAGLHPFDRTARPQIVRKQDNPEYYNLIKEFENITNVGALMNTSFNIHGESIVGDPSDAIDTFIRSGIDHLYIGTWLISKK